jgi:hypothetical protein
MRFIVKPLGFANSLMESGWRLVRPSQSEIPSLTKLREEALDHEAAD